MRSVRERLSYANVMATIAVVVAVGGGTAFAAYELGRNTVKSRNIAPGAVRAPDIAKGAVKRLKIAAGAVDTGKLAGAAVTTEKIAGESVEEPKLSPGVKEKVNALQRGSLIRVDAFVGAQADAPKIDLMSRGPFRIYAQCWQSGASTTGQVFAATSQPGTLAIGTLGNFTGQSTYLNPDTTGSQMRFATASVNAIGSGGLTGGVTMIHGSNAMTFGASGAVKGQNVAGDANNYGAGAGTSRCVFAPYVIAVSG